jgi:hypothetical protein
VDDEGGVEGVEAGLGNVRFTFSPPGLHVVVDDEGGFEEDGFALKSISICPGEVLGAVVGVSGRRFVAFTGSDDVNGTLPLPAFVKSCAPPDFVIKDGWRISPALLTLCPETFVVFGSGISNCPGEDLGASGAPGDNLLDAGVGVGSVPVNGTFLGFLKSCGLSLLVNNLPCLASSSFKN